MNYKIIKTGDMFTVLEKPTDLRLAVFEAEEDARKFMRRLNLGGAFDGWTPAFMQQKYFCNYERELVGDYK